MLDTGRHLWTLSKGGPQSLGLSCDADGLFLGPVALLQRRTSGGFMPRPQAELERILARGFGIGIPVQLDRLMPGLSVVASALNANDLCRARIAAVQLRVPDLSDALARLDMELEDVELKLDRIAKTTAAGDWEPAKHPRTGTAPNPGWFAPTGSGGGESDTAIRPTLVSDHRAVTAASTFRPATATTRSAICSNGSPTPSRKMRRGSTARSIASSIK